MITGPPELLGGFTCNVTDRAVHFSTGPLLIKLKNIGKGEAVNGFIAPPVLQFVPEKKVGEPFFDHPPSITEQTCRNKVSPQMKMFPLEPGQEYVISSPGEMGTASLIHVKSLTIPLVEPEPPPGEKPSKPVPIFPDTTMQWYAPLCVYYSDQAGIQYGSCRMYTLNSGGRFVFPRSETPLKATFQQTFGDFCDN